MTRELNLTGAQFEHTLGILAEIDLSALLNAFGGSGSLVDLLSVLPMLGQAREKRILRRLEAVWSATPDELDAAESDTQAMRALEQKAGRTPVTEILAGLTDFFGGLGLSQSGTPDFSKALGSQTEVLIGSIPGSTGPSPSGA